MFFDGVVLLVTFKNDLEWDLIFDFNFADDNFDDTSLTEDRIRGTRGGNEIIEDDDFDDDKSRTRLFLEQ